MMSIIDKYLNNSKLFNLGEAVVFCYMEYETKSYNYNKKLAEGKELTTLFKQELKIAKKRNDIFSLSLLEIALKDEENNDYLYKPLIDNIINVSALKIIELLELNKQIEKKCGKRYKIDDCIALYLDTVTKEKIIKDFYRDYRKTDNEAVLPDDLFTDESLNNFLILCYEETKRLLEKYAN